MNILGISAFYHDSAAALIQDGRIVAAAQEERFTRKRHDEEFPRRAAAYCLKEGGIDASKLDIVAFYDKPWLKFERLLKTWLAYAPRGLRSFSMGMPVWLRRKLWTRNILREELGYAGELLFTEHHESHAASAFFPSPFQEAAVLTMDGVGEWATASIGRGEGNKLTLLSELRFPHSLGLLYSAFTYYCGFTVNSGEHKLMGLAPYGRPKYADLIYEKLIDLKADGSFALDMRYFDYCAGLTMTSPAFHDLFGGAPRRPESALTERDQDLAASVQAVTEEAMLRMARQAQKATGSRRLCLAGGVALNCVGNGRILREGVFDELWVQPAAGDAGGALGAALFAWHQIHGKPRTADGKRDAQQGSLLGPAWSQDELAAFCRSIGAPHTIFSRDEMLKTTARALAEGKVVGWFNGRMEYGPRALGSRSILGDPRDPGMQSRMNLKTKFRESFRPFAPAVLAERAGEFFELDVESPYMLLTAAVREGRVLPAVTHVDRSSRVQTVGPEANADFRALLQEFDRQTSCPVLINTSFNVRGEPIVCTPQEAYTCFLRTDIDLLVLGNCVLDKKEQPKADPSWMKKLALD